VLSWLASVENRRLFVSVVTIGEVQAGIERAREQDSDKADEIEAWLERIAATYNILNMDARTFRRYASLMHRKPAHLIEDAMIAATAIEHDLIIATRNDRDFAVFGVETLNPFAQRAG
jgi:predicted nucleic acid-binding protein